MPDLVGHVGGCEASGIRREREHGIHHSTSARRVQVDTSHADGSESSRSGEFVEQSWFDEAGVQAVENLDEALNHLPQRRRDLWEVGKT